MSGVKIIDKWNERGGDGVYEVNSQDGWVNASQADHAAQDVLAAMSPADALRLASALILAAEDAKTHKRWQKHADADADA